METKSEFITLREAAALVPPNGVHLMTLYRWATKGVQGGLHKLRIYRTPGRCFTTAEWLNDFLAGLQPQPQGGDGATLDSMSQVDVRKALERELHS